MARRKTTIVLDEEADSAARQLAEYYGCPVPDAIRRSVIAQRDLVAGVPKEIRQQRIQALNRLFEMFEGNDADAEVRRLKLEDPGF